MELISSNGNKYLTDQEKNEVKQLAEIKYGEFLTALGFNWQDDVQMKETPMRVAKMYIDELFKGSYSKAPDLKEFDNEGKYDGIVFSGNILVQSNCAHHALPFSGNCFVSYAPDPNGKVVGLSKLNRIVDFYCRRPCIQENLTMNIHNHLDQVLTGNHGVAVLIEADHFCVRLRGAKQNSTMITSKLSGYFLEENGSARKEFYDNIKFLKTK
jgi:GTP cyclohydrolase I